MDSGNVEMYTITCLFKSAFYLLRSRSDVVNFIKEMTIIGTAKNGGACMTIIYVLKQKKEQMVKATLAVRKCEILEKKLSSISID